MLVVKGGRVKGPKVTWGKRRRSLPAAELAKGINLAAEFIDNPFSEVQEGGAAYRQQQDFETPLVKMMHELPEYEGMAPEEKAAFDHVREKLVAKDRMLRDASAEAVKPVRHVIKMEVVK